MLEEPSTIAIDDAAGSVAAIGTAAEVLADKEPKDIRVIHPLGGKAAQDRAWPHRGARRLGGDCRA
jgi:actin-like ATPase involved in cell morphogenesis